MKKYSCFLVVLITCISQLTQASVVSSDYQAVWAGIDVMGVDAQKADELRTQLPIKIGDSITIGEVFKCREECESIIAKHVDDSDVECGFMVYDNSDLFLTVDVIPYDAQKVVFRTIPEKNEVEQDIPEELQLAYQKLIDRCSQLFSEHVDFKEDFDHGYLDYDEPTLHMLAEDLSMLANKHNDLLLDILHYSKNSDKRSDVAALFSWSKRPDNLKWILERNLLMDPDKGVRNNLTRSFTYFMKDIKDKTLLRDLLPVYCKQMSLPTHMDRNKALFSVKRILTYHPDIIIYVGSDCKNTLRYISDMSILDNVGGIAKDILDLIDKAENV